MDIIKRNFFKLVSSGAFNYNMSIEPMYRYKWQYLEHIIIDFHLEQYSINGAKLCSEVVPSWVYNDMEGSYKENAYKTIDKQQLSNKLLNHRLNLIRNNERHAIDTSMESMELLNIIIANVNRILKVGVSLEFILQLGSFLRTKGSKVDFIKIDRWLNKLHIHNMAEFVGSILITVFNFNKEELPFVNKVYPSALNFTLKSLNSHQIINYEWHFKQKRNGIVLNTSPTARKSISRCLAFITYAPIESMSNFLGGLARGLSEIEE